MPEQLEVFVASVAQTLNSNQIPCILWGHYLLNIHGIPSALASVDYVIPDSCLSAGIHALTHLDALTPCPDPKVCLASSRLRQTPPPSFHAHIDEIEITVSLYLQSETLWFLEPLDRSLASPKTVKLPSSFVFASDQKILPPWQPGREFRIL